MDIFKFSLSFSRLCSIFMLWLFFKFAISGFLPYHEMTHLEKEINMMKYEVIPDYISFVPDETLKVTYLSNATRQKIFSNFGNLIRPQDLINRPNVEWKAKRNSSYALIMTELDVPCQAAPFKREKQIWVVGNIPGMKLPEGKTITSYTRPKPVSDSATIPGSRRVVVSLYKQPKPKIDYSWEPRLYERCDDESRECFSTKNFTKKHGLGEVIAFNFFQTEWNPNVTYFEDEIEDYEHEHEGFR